MRRHLERANRRIVRRRSRHGAAGRLGRDDLRFVVLGLLAEGPGHGYDLTRSLEARTQGAYAPDPAEIYPTLAMLEDEGFIDVTPDADGRKLYAVNAFGRASLADERVAADAAFTRLDAAAALRRRFKEGAWGVFQHIAAAMGPRGPAAARKDI